jgi:hypothetical protein
MAADFEQLIREEAERHRPRTDYAAWSDEQLVLTLVVLRAVARECVARIIDKPEVDSKTINRRAASLADDPNPAVLAHLSALCGTDQPLRFLVFVRLELAHLAIELMRRIGRTRVGVQLVAFLRPYPEGSATALQVFNALWRVLSDQRLKSRGPSKDDRALAVAKAWEYYLKMGREVAHFSTSHGFSVPPPSTAGVPAAKREGWESFNALVLLGQLNLALARFLPILRGQVDELPENVRQALRDHWEKGKAQKRTGVEVELDEMKLPDESSPIRVKTTSADDTALSAEAYRLAERRWGAKGTRFLDALLESGSVVEASSEAGVSRQTGHKYLRELRKGLTK